MINSMTGYASGSAQVGSVSLDLEIKSVNSKSLDLKIYLPEYLSSLENELRQVASSKVVRGSVVLKIKGSQLSELSSKFVLAYCISPAWNLTFRLFFFIILIA